MTDPASRPDLRARLHLADLAVLDGDSDKSAWSAACSMATRCIRAEFTFDEYADLLYESEIGYQLRGEEQRKRPTDRQRFNRRVQRAWDFAEDSYDYGYRSPGLDVPTTAALVWLLSSATPALKAIIEIALEEELNPVSASVKQVYERVGGRRSVVEDELRQLAANAGPDSPVLAVTERRLPGRPRPVRVWELNPAFSPHPEGGICTSPGSSASMTRGIAQQKMIHYVPRIPRGERFTTKQFAGRAGVSVDSARPFLSKRVEEVGDVFKIPGERRKREPDIWVKDLSWEQRQQEARERDNDEVRRYAIRGAEEDPLGWVIARDDQREIRKR